MNHSGLWKDRVQKLPYQAAQAESDQIGSIVTSFFSAVPGPG